MADKNLTPSPDRDERLLLAKMHLMRARWLAAEQQGGLPYREQLDGFLARMNAAEMPPEVVEVTRRVLAGGEA